MKLANLISIIYLEDFLSCFSTVIMVYFKTSILMPFSANDIGIDEQDFLRTLMLLMKYKFDSTENTSFYNGNSANSKKYLWKLVLASFSP